MLKQTWLKRNIFRLKKSTFIKPAYLSNFDCGSFSEETTQNSKGFWGYLTYTSAHHLHPHKHGKNTFVSCIWPLLVVLDYYVISVYQYNLSGTNSKTVFLPNSFPYDKNTSYFSLLHSHAYLHPSLIACGLSVLRKYSESLQKINYFSSGKTVSEYFYCLKSILIFTAGVLLMLLILEIQIITRAHQKWMRIKTALICQITFVNWGHQ